MAKAPEPGIECCVCFEHFNRMDKIPRMLHCHHTFCASCVKKMSQRFVSVCTVRCPLCRWITCTDASLPVTGALWVNTEVWDILVRKKMEEFGELQVPKKEEEPVATKKAPPSQTERFKQKMQQMFKKR